MCQQLQSGNKPSVRAPQLRAKDEGADNGQVFLQLFPLRSVKPGEGDAVPVRKGLQKPDPRPGDPLPDGAEILRAVKLIHRTGGIVPSSIEIADRTMELLKEVKA